MTPLADLERARQALRDGATPDELLEAADRRRRELERGDRPLHAFLSTRDVRSDGAVGRRGDAAAGGGPASPLEGIPVAVKDNLCTLDLPTTCGSRMLEGYRSPYQATVVRRLEGAGARIYGKTNLDEFAMGSSTEHSAFGPTRNPFDRERVPGGSSGGSAAAVAAGIVPVALGSSTGGSVRQPAALCGVVGLKPTYGRVSRYGLVAFGSSLDQVGVLASRVRDAARALEVIAGRDSRDATSRGRPVPRAEALEGEELEGRVLGVPEQYLDGLHPGLRSRLDELAGRIRAAGAEVRRVSLPTTRHAVPCYQVVSTAEASSNLARFDGVRFGRREEGGGGTAALQRASRGRGFGEEVKRRIMLGTCALSAGRYEDHYLRARRVRRAVARDLLDAFEDGVDALLAPTTAGPAFRLGERTEDPYEMYRSDRFSVAANLAGVPAVSIPAGLVEGLPVGVQLLAPPWAEEAMLGLAGRIEELVGYEPPEPA